MKKDYYYYVERIIALRSRIEYLDEDYYDRQLEHYFNMLRVLLATN